MIRHLCHLNLRLSDRARYYKGNRSVTWLLIFSRPTVASRSPKWLSRSRQCAWTTGTRCPSSGSAHTMYEFFYSFVLRRLYSLFDSGNGGWNDAKRLRCYWRRLSPYRQRCVLSEWSIAWPRNPAEDPRRSGGKEGSFCSQQGTILSFKLLLVSHDISFSRPYESYGRHLWGRTWWRRDCDRH